MQVVDLEGRVSTMDFRRPSPVSISGDDSEEAGPRVPETRDKVSGSILLRPLLTCLEGRCERYRSSTTEPYCLLVNGDASESIIHRSSSLVITLFTKVTREVKIRRLMLRRPFSPQLDTGNVHPIQINKLFGVGPSPVLRTLE